MMLQKAIIGVTPGQILNISIPAGGKGTAGGKGSGGGCIQQGCGKHQDGEPGENGTSGYLKLSWTESAF